MRVPAAALTLAADPVRGLGAGPRRRCRDHLGRLADLFAERQIAAGLDPVPPGEPSPMLTQGPEDRRVGFSLGEPAPDLVNRDFTGTGSGARRADSSQRPRVNYTSFRFWERLQDNGILPSMGSVDDSYDNALMENFWSTLKIELVYRTRTRGAVAARKATRTGARHR